MKKTTRLALIATALTLLPGLAPAEEGKDAVLAALTKFAESFNAKDAKAIAATYDEDGTFVNIQGKEIRGREAIEEAVAASFAGPMKNAQISVTADSLRLLTAKVALQTDLFYVAGRKDEAGKDVPIQLSHYMIVWIKRVDGWKIAALQSMIPTK
jgi:uncharacterized protein (TIGR02246 family)